MHFDLEQVDLGTMIRDVVSRLSADLSPTGAPVTARTEGNQVGEWDRFRLDQVVTNLLSNAIKYGEGKPIDVSAVRSGDLAIVKVIDRGVGIEPSMLTKVFDPFQRVAEARHNGGLGLGLHIAKTTVNGLDGTISVDSRPGAGATFVVALPVSRSDQHGSPAHPGGR